MHLRKRCMKGLSRYLTEEQACLKCLEGTILYKYCTISFNSARGVTCYDPVRILEFGQTGKAALHPNKICTGHR
jgi:hypothetical protein